jgi:hypothetical protein
MGTAWLDVTGTVGPTSISSLSSHESCVCMCLSVADFINNDHAEGNS